MKILIAGDYVPQKRVNKFLEDRRYESFLGDIKPIVESADYSIVNLEAPIIYGQPSPIKKNGPNLFCNENVLDSLQWCGFDCITLANNHFYDQGDVGIKNTISCCRNRGVDYVGAGMDVKEASSILYKKIKGETLAIINACEHEYSIATKEHGGAHELNEIDVYYDIQTAKQQADVVIVIIHGGIENCQIPPKHLVKKMRFFADAGAAAVICHHQHCYSGFEYYNNVPIFYGLGNFCFDELKNNCDSWSQGYMVMLDCSNSVTEYFLYPYIQCGEEPVISLMKENEKSDFFYRIDDINNIIQNDDKLDRYLMDYYNSTESQYNPITQIYPGNKWIQKLYYHGLIPSLFNTNNWNLLRDVLLCASHAERFLHYTMKRTTNQK